MHLLILLAAWLIWPPVSGRPKKLKDPVRSGRLTSLFGAAVVRIRPREADFPKLHILPKNLVNTQMHRCAEVRIAALPPMDLKRERVWTAARCLRMKNIHGAGALPGKD